MLIKHYNFRKITSKVKDSLLKKIKDQLIDRSENIDYSCFENWDLKERQAKFIVNSAKTYEYFGFEHRLPLMDYELMDFFVNISSQLKKGKLLYDKLLKGRCFEKYNLNFENELQATKKDIEIQKIKQKIKNIIPASITNLYKYGVNKLGDTYFYIEITGYMAKELKLNGIEIDKSGRDKNSIIAQWYIQKIINNG